MAVYMTCDVCFGVSDHYAELRTMHEDEFIVCLACLERLLDEARGDDDDSTPR